MPSTIEFVIPHGGTRPRPCAELRSPILRAHGDQIAAESFRRIYQAWPELGPQFGERGRRLTGEDNLWHLNFLDAALALNDPSYFQRYAAWLVRFLGPRGLGPEHIAGAFGFLAEGIANARIPEDQTEHRQRLVQLLKETVAQVRQENL